MQEPSNPVMPVSPVRRQWRIFLMLTAVTGLASFFSSLLIVDPSRWLLIAFQLFLPLSFFFSVKHRVTRPAFRGSLYLLFSVLSAVLLGMIFLVVLIASLLGNAFILDVMFYLLAALTGMLQFFCASWLLPMKDFGRGLLTTIAAALVAGLLMSLLSGVFDTHFNILEGNEHLDMIFDYAFFPIPLWQLLVGGAMLAGIRNDAPPAPLPASAETVVS